MTLAAGTKLGPYEIVAPIGAGGMGEVYRARDGRLARDVAIKILPASFVGDPERLRRFEQEARAAGQLNHPNILAVYDTGVHEGTPYVVAELLEGETLRERVAGGPLPARKAIDYSRQIAQGLAAAHHKGIVHRDLKPENLFLTTDGRAKILDFGLAKLTSPDEAPQLSQAPTRAATGAGVVLGTVGYMSPEQVRGDPADHRSDIFSFGTILYEMLTGRRAFEAGSSIETMSAILKHEPPAVSRAAGDVPPGLERIVEHCMEKSRDERFQSARDLAFDLESLSDVASSSAARRAMAVAGRWSRVRRLLGAALVIALAGAAFFLGRRTRTPEGQPTYSQLTFRQGTIFSARLSPDGQTVVYGAAWDGNPVELFAARPGSPESRSLGLPGAEVLSISSSGEMAVLLNASFTLGWMRSGTLARAPLSGGAPRPILDHVQGADWDPAGKDLAVVRSDGGRYRLEYPIGTVLYETTGWMSGPRFSRDGRRLAFLEHLRPGDDRGQVGVVDLSGKVTMLTESFSSAAGLAWSPTGKEIWFTAGLTGNVKPLLAVDLAGRQRLIDGAPADLTLQDVSSRGSILLSRNTSRRGMVGLAPGETAERDLSWLDWSRPGALSPDGRWLLFEEQGQGGGEEYSVYIRSTDGSPAVRLGEGYSSALSPDGKWAMAIPLTQTDRLVFLPRGVGASRTVNVPGFDLTGAGWFPDGRRFLLWGREGRGEMSLFVMESEEAKPRLITTGITRRGFALSPDSETVAAVGPDNVVRLYPVGGGEPRPVPGVEPEDRVLGWSDDGGALFVARANELPARVQRLDLKTGKKTPWKELGAGDRAGLLDVGFVLLSADGRSYVYSYRKVLATLYLVEGLQ